MRGRKLNKATGGKTLRDSAPNRAVFKEAEATKPVGKIGGEDYMTLLQPEKIESAPGARLSRKRGGATKWIQGAVEHPGSLRKALKIPEGEKIPEKKLKKAENSQNQTLRKRAVLAETLKHMKH